MQDLECTEVGRQEWKYLLQYAVVKLRIEGNIYTVSWVTAKSGMHLT
jgi:hypothetical protein